ncbi:MAG: hypothetical protein JSS51_04425 [Planctomycetes bacterium]|nr:hypothetical protein [Planctomycetota bacterium]
MALAGKVQAQMNWQYTNGTGIEAVAASAGITPSDWTTNYQDGTGSGKAQKLIVKQGSISSGANLDLDLAGVLTDVFGNTITLAKIKAIAIRNKATGTGVNLLVGGSATNPVSTILGGTSPSLKIGPTGFWLHNSPVDGFAITGGTGDILRLTASGGAVDYELVIFGE